jgi:hypothetical protein
MSTPARLTLVLAWVLTACLRRRRPVWPPVPCLPEVCLLPPAVRLSQGLGLEHQQLPRWADVYRRLLHREETPNLERLDRSV